MKIVYRNKPMNRQKNISPSIKTLLLMSCIVLTMVAIKVMYNPTDGLEEAAAMATITGETLSDTTEDTDEPTQ